MEVKIYLIEDINDIKYVGSTKSTLNTRLSQHKYHKKINKQCSSSKLNLDNCIITELECCNDENRKEREQYYIDTIDCVNKNNTYFDKDKNKQYQKEYYENNKEKIKEQKKIYHQNNKEKNKEKLKEYRKEYRKLEWYCPNCKCNVKLADKAKHLKTKKHHLNTNNFLIETQESE